MLFHSLVQVVQILRLQSLARSLYGTCSSIIIVEDNASLATESAFRFLLFRDVLEPKIVECFSSDSIRNQSP